MDTEPLAEQHRLVEAIPAALDALPELAFGLDHVALHAGRAAAVEGQRERAHPPLRRAQLPLLVDQGSPRVILDLGHAGVAQEEWRSPPEDASRYPASEEEPSMPRAGATATWLIAFLTATLCVAGCGGDDSEEDDPGTPGGNAPCQDGSISFVGRLGGGETNTLYDFSSFSFDQLADPKALDVAFGDGAGNDGSIHLEWPELVANGDQTPVTGDLALPASGTSGPTTWTAGAGSALSPTGNDEYKFSLSLGGDDHLDGCVVNAF